MWRIDFDKLELVLKEVEKNSIVCIIVIFLGEVNIGWFVIVIFDMFKICSLVDCYKVWIYVDGVFGIFVWVLFKID